MRQHGSAMTEMIRFILRADMSATDSSEDGFLFDEGQRISATAPSSARIRLVDADADADSTFHWASRGGC
jgi:hypothetical protein